MAKKNTNNFAAIIRGLKAVAQVTFTKKPIETDFKAETPENNQKKETTQSDDNVPLRKIGTANELIITHPDLREMDAFFTNHAILDAYSTSCLFNNESCEINLCVFPRIIRPAHEQPFVKDVIAVTIWQNNTLLAMAEYNTVNANASREFREDVLNLMPEYYRHENRRTPVEMAESKFPGVVFPDAPMLTVSEPVEKE